MRVKFKEILESLKKRYDYDRCYDSNEGNGAIFGMCNGCNDTYCPYYTSIDKEE